MASLFEPWLAISFCLFVDEREIPQLENYSSWRGFLVG